jgi:hypothetical protein
MYAKRNSEIAQRLTEAARPSAETVLRVRWLRDGGTIAGKHRTRTSGAKAPKENARFTAGLKRRRSFFRRVRGLCRPSERTNKDDALGLDGLSGLPVRFAGGQGGGSELG